MKVRRRIAAMIASIIVALGMSTMVASPAFATDGDMYGCGGPYYCIWVYTPHSGIPPNQRWYVPSMVNCQWYYVNETIVIEHAVRSQGNGSASWLEAFNGYDGGRAIIYGWATGRYPSAMSTYWTRMSAVRKIPAGATHC